MIDIRPVGYVLGWLVALLGAMMAFPLLIDVVAEEPNARAFAVSMLVTVTTGVCVALASGRRKQDTLDLR